MVLKAAGLAADAVTVEDRLNFLGETETARRAVEGPQRFRPLTQRLRQRQAGHGAAVLVLVAAHARGVLARLERGPAAHRLHHAAALVQQLEVDRRPRRDFEEDRAVLADGGVAHNPFRIPRAVADGHRRADQGPTARPAVAVGADARRAELQRHHAQRLDCAPVDARQARPGIYVLDVEGSGCVAVIDQARTHPARGARPHGNGLAAGQAGIVHQPLAGPAAGHPVDPEPRPERPFGPAPADGMIGHQVLGPAQRVRILKQFAFLPEGIDLHRGRVADRGDQLRAGVLLAAFRRVDQNQFARLPGMMARGDGRDFLSPRHAASVQNRGGEPRVAAVEVTLVGPVGVHLQQRLRIDLPAVVVLPTRVQDAAVVRDRRIIVMDLIECQPPQETAVAVAAVQIADLGPPAVDDLHAAGRVEDDVAVRQVGGFVIRDAQAAGQLPDGPRCQVHLVQMVVVFAVGFLPGEQHAAAVVGHIRIADHAARIVDQRLDAQLVAVPACQAKRRAGDEMAFRLRVRLAFGVGVVRAAQRVMLGEHELRHAFAERPQSFCPAQATGVGVQAQPGGIVGRRRDLAQRLQAGRDGLARRPQIVQHAADQLLLERCVAPGFEEPAEFALGVEIVPGGAKRTVLQQPVGLRPIRPEPPVQIFPDGWPIGRVGGQLEVPRLQQGHVAARGRHALGPGLAAVIQVGLGRLCSARDQARQPGTSFHHEAASS